MVSFHPVLYRKKCIHLIPTLSWTMSAIQAKVFQWTMIKTWLINQKICYSYFVEQTDPVISKTCSYFEQKGRCSAKTFIKVSYLLFLYQKLVCTFTTNYCRFVYLSVSNLIWDANCLYLGLPNNCLLSSCLRYWGKRAFAITIERWYVNLTGMSLLNSF